MHVLEGASRHHEKLPNIAKIVSVHAQEPNTYTRRWLRQPISKRSLLQEIADLQADVSYLLDAYPKHPPPEAKVRCAFPWKGSLLLFYLYLNVCSTCVYVFHIAGVLQRRPECVPFYIPYISSKPHVSDRECSASCCY